MKKINELNMIFLAGIFGFWFMSSAVFAQKAQIKMDDINADQDTSITIQKGPKATKNEPDYEIVSGNDEITGDEEIDDKKSLASWKEACANWKKEIRELNTDNKILILSCGSRKRSKTETRSMYSSQASYKIRVRIRDSK